MLALHAAALALFAFVAGGGAPALARPLIAAGFALLAASFVVAQGLTTRPAPPAGEPDVQAVYGDVAHVAESSELRVAA